MSGARWRVESWRGLVHALGLSRCGLYVTVETAAGVGTGEASPLPGYSASSLEDVAAELAGWVARAPDPRTLTETPDPVAAIEAATRTIEHAAARHGVEQALLSYLATTTRTSVSALLAPELPTEPTVSHALVSSLTDATAAVQAGVNTLKLKVGRRPWSADLAVLATIRERHPRVRVRLDANGAWALDEARAYLADAVRLGVELVEEPLAAPSPGAFVELRAATDVRLAIDESCRDAVALSRWLSTPSAVDALVIKPMETGIFRACALARTAAAAGLDVIVTTTLDSPVARRAALAVSHTIPHARRATAGLAITSCATVERPASRGMDVLADAIHQAAVANPSAPAWLDSGDVALSWQAVDAWVDGLAAGLADRRVGAGDIIAIADGRDLETLARVFAVARVGATAFVTAPGAPPSTAVGTRLKHVTRWEAGARSAGPPRPWRLDDTPLMVCTSGTTGPPRTLSLTVRQLGWSAFGSAMRLGQLPSDRWLHCLPLHHVGGLSILFRTAWAGASLTMLPRFEVDAVNRHLDSGDITHVSLVPSMLRQLLDARGDAPLHPNVRVMLVGGGATSPELLARCRAIDAPVALTWGMTEAASQVATRRPGDLRPVGGLAPLCTATIDTSDAGALIVASPTGERPTLLTNDRGVTDAAGEVVVEGRLDDVIRSGGESIDLAALEAALRAHDSVEAAAVVACADPVWGQVPAAMVVVAPPDDGKRHGGATKAELAAYLAGRFARFAIPKRIDIVDELPRTSLGKISRGAVRSALSEPQPTELNDATEPTEPEVL